MKIINNFLKRLIYIINILLICICIFYSVITYQESIIEGMSFNLIAIIHYYLLELLYQNIQLYMKNECKIVLISTITLIMETLLSIYMDRARMIYFYIIIFLLPYLMMLTYIIFNQLDKNKHFNNKGREIQRYKLIFIIITGCFILNLGLGIYSSNTSTGITTTNMDINNMRFSIKIKAGKYKSWKFLDSWYMTRVYNKDSINKDSKTIEINDMDTKYSMYIISEDTTYIKCRLRGTHDIIYIEHTIPISTKILNNLKSFMKEKKSKSISVDPFNDGIYCLVTTRDNQYILNIETSKVVWKNNGDYTYGEVSAKTNTFIVKDSNSEDNITEYQVNNYGKLFKTLNKNISIETIIIILFINLLSWGIIASIKTRKSYN